MLLPKTVKTVKRVLSIIKKMPIGWCPSAVEKLIDGNMQEYF